MKKVPHILLLALSILLLAQAAHAEGSLADSARLRNEAILAMQLTEQPQKQIDLLTPGDLTELPLSMSTIVSNVEYRIAFTNVQFHETYAELTAYAKVTIPQGQTLFFGLSGLKLSYQGGFIGTARLTLLGDVSIPINGGSASVVLKGGFDIKNGRALDNLTYIEIDCAGFKEAGLTAEVLFPRSMLIPCDNAGNQLPKKTDQVRGAFRTVVHDWNDILVDINLPPFQMNGLNDVVFSLGRAVFDFSDSQNSSSVRFPSGYRERYLQLPDVKLWRGIYASNLTVMLPKAFTPEGKTARATFEATDLLIDNNGISGNFLGRNILNFEQGNASGWHFSVNEFQVGIEANTLVQAGFSGSIALPIAQKDTMSYTAIIAADNKYLLKVSPKDTMNIQLWMAKMQLEPNSWVKLEVKDDRFFPEAMLYGRLDIEAKLSAESTKPIARFDGITFKALHLQTKEPYLSVGYLGYEGEISVANFPASISNIAFSTSGKTTSLSFNMGLTLMDNVFKGSTRISIVGSMEEQNGYHRWSYDRCELGRIKIDNAQMGGFSISGEVEFLNNDPIYGDGFGGAIRMELDCMASMALQVRARFGKTDFRYWFVDGLAEFSPGFQVSVLNINGLSGGAYYRMSRMKNMVSSTGLPEYKPDKTTSLGVKFGLMFTLVNPAAPILDGQVEFEMAFNNHGGLNYIGLFGNGIFLGSLPGGIGKIADKATALYSKAQDKVGELLEGLSDAAKISTLAGIQKLRTDKPTEAAQAVETGFKVEDGQFNGLAAYFGISYDFQANAFHASFEVYVNAAMGLLQGIGQNYRAGYAEIHSEPGNWHVYMGTPNDPVGIQFGLGDFRIRTESYFMAGTSIPGSPPPPQEVADILGLDRSELDYMRDLNALGDGKGMAFGAHLKLETGDLSFLILYANFKAGLGFDLMLKQYENTYCEGSNKPIGINGWYANAQAYAFLQGELGVKVNLFFIKARFPIIKGAAAALLQAKLPNPAWFRGYLGVKFELLGGMVSGNMRFKLEFGKECKIVNPDGTYTPVGIAVISDLTPKATTDVDVFAAPQAAFNFAVGRDIPLADDEGDKVFRIELEHFTMTENGKPIEGQLKWNSRKDAVSFYSKEILPPNTSITADVKVSFKEKKGETWQTVYMYGKKSEESRTITFVTGTAPEEVPLHNISYSWPVVDQRSFYPGESTTGYIQLKRGQAYLFRQDATQELMVAKSGGERQFSSFRYNAADCRLEFAIPSIQLASDYALAVVNKSAGGATEGGSTVSQTKTEEGTFSVANREAMSFSREDIARTLLEYPFRSSAHKLFADKVNAAQTTQTVFIPYSSAVISLLQKVSNLEPFDLCELAGTEYTEDKPLVQPVAVTDDAYYQSKIHPLIYERYPLDNMVFDRDTTIWGVVPVRALPVIASYQMLVEQGRFNSTVLTGQLPYIYELPLAYSQDYHDLKTKVVNRYLGTSRQKEFARLIESYFPFISNGYYKVQYRFVLPGGRRGSAATVQYHNPIL